MNKYTIRRKSDLAFIATQLGYTREAALYEYCSWYNLDVSLYIAVPYGW